MADADRPVSINVISSGQLRYIKRRLKRSNRSKQACRHLLYFDWCVLQLAGAAVFISVLNYL